MIHIILISGLMSICSGLPSNISEYYGKSIKLDIPADLLIGKRLVLALEPIVPTANISVLDIDFVNKTPSTVSPTTPNMGMKKLIENKPDEVLEFIFDVDDKCPSGYQLDMVGVCRPVFNIKRFRGKITTTTPLANSTILETTTFAPTTESSENEMKKMLAMLDELEEGHRGENNVKRKKSREPPYVLWSIADQIEDQKRQ